MPGRFKGGVRRAISANSSGDFTGQASGIWELTEQLQLKADGQWPLSALVPEAPTSASAQTGIGQATISFAPQNERGSSVTFFTVISSPHSVTATGVSSPITVTGLTDGTEYTFTVTATNGIGTSESSNTTNAIIPGLPVNTAPPTISQSGNSVSTTNGIWTSSPAPSFTYQWTRNGTPIPGATSSNYAMQFSDGAQTITCVVTATNSGGSANAAASNSISPPKGQSNYTSPGTYTWICPQNVYRACGLAIGGGGGGASTGGNSAGGGGGGLGWINDVSVTPGSSYTIYVGGGGAGAAYSNSSGGAGGSSHALGAWGYGGGFPGSGYGQNTPGGSGGGRSGNGGGNGGSGGHTSGQGGGGGAGGYSGNGGSGSGSSNAAGAAGAGGAGGAGGNGPAWGVAGGGGGTGIYGEGSSGYGGNGGNNNPGGGGSGGNAGSSSGGGGAYGGGGGGRGGSFSLAGFGASGAARVIWGPGRFYPSTNTGNA